ncbi:TonB-dependent receptor [Porphyromonas gingivalis]|uniref:TonB-dependent receptor n=1 Tax=Porphyromonas gingivalis TaxID=837 RepID=UPI0012FD9CEC|nr:carboxypeptidase-like regulatory domain-containing protein [Porphyromonas gingivalis]
MKTLKIFTCLLLFACMKMSAQEQVVVHGLVVDSLLKGIEFVNISLQRDDNSIIQGGITDSSGRFSISISNEILPKSFIVKVSCVGFETYTREHTSPNIGTIILKESSFNLSEVVVRPEELQDLMDHKSFRFDAKKLSSFSNALDATTLISTISLDFDQKLKSIDGRKVKILINGINATEYDLMALPPNLISRVDYYEDPPARFARYGIGALINIVTKSLTGGAAFVNANNAVTIASGNNQVNFTYNVDKMRLTADFSNLYRRSTSFEDETINYTFGGNVYNQERMGLASPFKWDLNGGKIGMTYADPGKYQLSATVRGEIHNRDKSVFQNLSENGLFHEIHKTSKDQYKLYSIDIYGEKMFGKSSQLLLNVIGTAYDTQLTSSYRDANFSNNLLVEGNKYSAITDAQYQYRTKNVVLNVGFNDFIEYNKQIISTNIKHEDNTFRHTLRAFADFSFRKGKINYYLGLGLSYGYFSTSNIENSISTLDFTPKLRVAWNPTEKFSIFANIQRETINPSISLLSKTPVIFAPEYVYVGNPKLTSYKQNTFLIGGHFSSNYATMAWNLFYKHSPNGFVPFFMNTGDYIAQSYDNISLLQKIGVVGKINVMPLGNPTIVLSVTGAYYQDNMKSNSLDWNFSSFRVISELSFNLKKWNAKIFYQTPLKSIDGQLIQKHPQASFIEANYHTKFGLSLGGGIKYLFMKEYSDGRATHPKAILHMDTRNKTAGYANMIYLKVSYVFKFGKSPKKAEQKIKNYDNDSGILVQ